MTTMKRAACALAILLGVWTMAVPRARAQASGPATILVKKTDDFQVNGLGDNASWQKTAWVPITVQESAGQPLATNIKMLYSATGIYFLYQCRDRKLTATIQEDFKALHPEDVVEAFIQPDSTLPLYLEYQLSPLNHELAILIPNINGKFTGWRPWHYTDNLRVRHATSAEGGKLESNATVTGWTAEFFMPYRLLFPMLQTPPTSGSRWRGNLFRIDHDQGYTTWTWQKTSGNFHEMEKFGVWLFE